MMHRKELLCKIWLTSVFGYGSKKPKELIEAFGSAAEVFEKGREKLYFGARDKVRLAFEEKNLDYAEYVLRRCEESGVSIVTIDEPEYPELLRHIPNPPLLFYYMGDISLLNKNPFTVVGTRKCDDEGRKMVMDFLPALQKAGFSIISGFAEGIENYIHKNIRKTVAVLPYSIDVCHPGCNKGLKGKIIKNGGLVITEIAFNMKSFNGSYHLRNRLLAGISNGVLVIEASERSGTSITASAAGDYGRDVYVIPGSIYNPRFKGIIDMMRNNAIPVSEPSDIISDYERLEGIIQPNSNQNKAVNELKDERYSSLTDEEKVVLECINGNRMHADEISLKTGLDVSAVNAALISLEISDMVAKLDGNQYIIQ